MTRQDDMGVADVIYMHINSTQSLSKGKNPKKITSKQKTKKNLSNVDGENKAKKKKKRTHSHRYEGKVIISRKKQERKREIETREKKYSERKKNVNTIAFDDRHFLIFALRQCLHIVTFNARPFLFFFNCWTVSKIVFIFVVERLISERICLNNVR